MMRAVRVVLWAVGLLALLVGLVWIGQGTGVFPYPASSFMINQRPWVYYGGGLAVVGLVLMLIARWRARR